MDPTVWLNKNEGETGKIKRSPSACSIRTVSIAASWARQRTGSTTRGTTWMRMTPPAGGACLATGKANGGAKWTPQCERDFHARAVGSMAPRRHVQAHAAWRHMLRCEGDFHAPNTLCSRLTWLAAIFQQQNQSRPLSISLLLSLWMPLPLPSQYCHCGHYYYQNHCHCTLLFIVIVVVILLTLSTDHCSVVIGIVIWKIEIIEYCIRCTQWYWDPSWVWLVLRWSYLSSVCYIWACMNMYFMYEL